MCFVRWEYLIGNTHRAGLHVFPVFASVLACGPIVTPVHLRCLSHPDLLPPFRKSCTLSLTRLHLPSPLLSLSQGGYSPTLTAQLGQINTFLQQNSDCVRQASLSLSFFSLAILSSLCNMRMRVICGLRQLPWCVCVLVYPMVGKRRTMVPAIGSTCVCLQVSLYCFLVSETHTQ